MAVRAPLCVSASNVSLSLAITSAFEIDTRGLRIRCAIKLGQDILDKPVAVDGDGVARLMPDTVPQFLELGLQHMRLAQPQRRLLARIRRLRRRAVLAVFGLDFALQFGDEPLVGLAGDDGQHVDPLVLYAFALLVDWQANTAADLLAAFRI